MKALRYEQADDLFRYDEASGILYWKRHATGRRKDLRAGNLGKTFSRVIVAGIKYPVQNIVWLLVHKEWPDREIDHADRNPRNNHISNLRLATRSQNMANRKQAVGVTGFIGVRRKKRKFAASIYIKGVTQHLGSYVTPAEAARVRDRAAKEAYGDFAILNFP